MPLSIQHYSPEDLRYEALAPGPLFKPCLNFVPAREAFKYVREMTALLKAASGLGLAANQVGLDIPLFLFTLEGVIQPCYRPRIIERSETFNDRVEECLSFPGFSKKVIRYDWVEVDFIAFPNNKRKHLTLHGVTARTFQHEYAHLQGRTIAHPW